MRKQTTINHNYKDELRLNKTKTSQLKLGALVMLPVISNSIYDNRRVNDYKWKFGDTMHL